MLQFSKSTSLFSYCIFIFTLCLKGSFRSGVFNWFCPKDHHSDYKVICGPLMCLHARACVFVTAAATPPPPAQIFCLQHLNREPPIRLFYKPIRVRVFLFVYLPIPIPILLRFGLHESPIHLEADFILSSADYVKPIVQNEQKAIPSQK